MTRRGALLATGLGALAVGAAGCGGGGGSSAVGTATATMTTTSQGGVLGAQANVDRQKLRAEANRVQAMLNRRLDQLRSGSSPLSLAGSAAQIRTQVLNAANRLDRLDLQSRRAQQQRAHLSSALRSLAADITTIQGDAQSGNLQKALGDLTQLSSLIAVRRSIGAIQSGSARAGAQPLRTQATTIAGTLETRLLQLAGASDAQAFADRTARLRQFLQQRERQVRGLEVPQAQQWRKQALLSFLDSWEATLDRAHDEAENGNLDQARTELKNGSISDIQSLVQSMR